MSREAIQKRLDELEPAPAVPLATQFYSATAQLRQYRSNFDTPAALVTANNAIEQLVNEKIGKSTDSAFVKNAIYLLLCKHEAGLASGEMLNECDKAFAQKLYLEEVLEMSRLRPFTEYDNRDEYAFDIVRFSSKYRLPT